MKFKQTLAEYLQLRNALGFRLKRDGKALSNFVTFLEERNASHITTKLAMEWAQERMESQPSSWAQRLRYVRGFAKYCSSIEQSTEIPPASLLPYRAKRARPFIYSDQQVSALLHASMELPGSAWKRQTYYHLIGLLSVTGMRISEAIALEMSNLDLASSLLTVEGSKFGKSRLIPLHDSTCLILAQYLSRRDEHLAGRVTNHVFFSMTLNKLDQGTIRRVFYEISRAAGIRGQNDSHGPRLHDFRHRFAVKTIMNWYQSGEDVERRLPTLSAYLGHSHVSDTYWYVSAYPELMQKVVERIEDFWGGLQ